MVRRFSEDNENVKVSKEEKQMLINNYLREEEYRRNNPPTLEQKRLRQGIREYYVYQRLRILQGQSLLANFMAGMKIKPSEIKPTPEKRRAKSILKTFEEEYYRKTHGLAIKEVEVRKILKQEFAFVRGDAEAQFAINYINLLKMEKKAYTFLYKLIEPFPLWTDFLQYIPEIGPASAGSMAVYLDPRKANYPTSYWKFCGYDVVDDIARGRGKDHLINVAYKDRHGEWKVKKSITYNAFMKKRMNSLSVVISSRSDCPYSILYKNYLNRLEQRFDLKGREESWLKSMARRYPIKILLIEVWMKSRDLLGLPLVAPWHEAKLGYGHHNFIADDYVPGGQLIRDYETKIKR